MIPKTPTVLIILNVAGMIFGDFNRSPLFAEPNPNGRTALIPAEPANWRVWAFGRKTGPSGVDTIKSKQRWTRTKPLTGFVQMFPPTQRGIWTKYWAPGSQWITPAYEPSGFAYYIAKEQRASSLPETLLFLEDFFPNRG